MRASRCKACGKLYVF
ncbi:hypothetical protein [Pseudomonas sp. FP597]